MILLDTDICVEILRGNQNVISRRLSMEDIAAISFITVGELYYGAERSSQKIQNKHIVDEFILSVPIINPDLDILKKFAEQKAYLKGKNQLLPDADIFIASIAMLRCSKLITGNTKHFSRFDNLNLENWTY